MENLRLMYLDLKQQEVLENAKVFLPDTVLAAPCLSVVGAVDEEDRLCGVLAGAQEAYVFRILFISVAQGQERNGIGTFLLTSLLERFYEDMVPVMVVLDYADDKEHAGLTRLLEKTDVFMMHRREDCFHVHPKSRVKSEIYQKLLKTDIKPQLFFSLPQRERNAFFQKLQKEGILYPKGIVSESDCEKDLCIYIGQKEIEGAVFFGKAEGSMIELRFLYISNHDTRVLQAAAHVIERKYSNFRITFTAANEASLSMAKRGFPDAHAMGRISAVWTGLLPEQMDALMEGAQDTDEDIEEAPEEEVFWG